MEDAGLVYKKGFTDIADFCIVWGEGIYQICVVKVYFLDLSESAYTAGFVTQLGYHTGFFNVYQIVGYVISADSCQFCNFCHYRLKGNTACHNHQ